MPGTAPPTPAAVEVVTQVLYYLSLSVPVGLGITVGGLAIPEAHGGVVSRQARGLAVPAALVVIVGVVLHVHAATHVSGIALIEWAALVVAALGVLAMRWTNSPALARGVAAVAVVAAVMPEIPVSFASPTRVVTSVLTAVHVLGAITWVGGLVVLSATALASRSSAARGGDGAAADWARIWDRFSLVALVAVGALIVSGSWLAWTHVGTPAQLLTTAYGRTLAVKLTLVIVLLCAGAYNVRVLLPRIHQLQRAGDTRGAFRLAAQHFPAVVLGEALVAIGILIVVPFLRGSARTQAGGATAVSFDLSTFAVGVVLVAVVAAAMWVGARSSLRPAQASTPAP